MNTWQRIGDEDYMYDQGKWWRKWNPKVGDIKPEGREALFRTPGAEWFGILSSGGSVSRDEINSLHYRVPCPCPLQVGDTVKVVRADPEWDFWIGEMDNWVGGTGVIEDIDIDGDALIEEFAYPPHCLEFVIRPEPAPEESVMKYWQPRIEPVVNGWTLADVPKGVLCKIATRSSDFFAHHDGNGCVWPNAIQVRDIGPSDCRVIRVIDPIPPGAMTLDKVPEGVRCVGVLNEAQEVMMRVGGDVLHVSRTGIRGQSDEFSICPSSVTVLHILDPIPQQTYTLETLPVGRVIEQFGSRYWKADAHQWLCHGTDGLFFRASPLSAEFTVTDYIMELKEVTR